MFEFYTKKDRYQYDINKRVSEYLRAARKLSELNMLRSIGYDNTGTENFLFFGDEFRINQQRS